MRRVKSYGLKKNKPRGAWRHVWDDNTISFQEHFHLGSDESLQRMYIWICMQLYTNIISSYRWSYRRNNFFLTSVKKSSLCSISVSLFSGGSSHCQFLRPTSSILQRYVSRLSTRYVRGKLWNKPSPSHFPWCIPFLFLSHFFPRGRPYIARISWCIKVSAYRYGEYDAHYALSFTHARANDNRENRENLR